MIVTRHTFKIKGGRMQKAIELVVNEIAEERERSGYAGQTRVYASSIGKFNELAVEWEYESLAEHESFWGQWNARPTTAAFFQEWSEVAAGDGRAEIWTLVG
jgi:hypothetical protein